MNKASRRLTVRARLYAIAAIGALLTAVVGVVGLDGNSRLADANAASARLSSTQAVTLETLVLQHEIRAQVWFAFAASAGGVDEPLEHIRQHYAKARDEIDDLSIRMLAAIEGTPYEQPYVAILKDQGAFINHAGELIEQAFADRSGGLAGIDGFEEESDALEQAVTALSGRLSRDRDIRLAQAHRVARTDTVTLLSAAALSALLVVGLSMLLARAILRALQRVITVARQIRAGDLNARCAVDGTDEISMLAGAFNDTADTLRETMRQLTAEARREGFGSQLAEAFEMADTEAETYAVIERTMLLLGSDHPTELLLADSSNARLTRRTGHAVASEPCCPVKSPFGCVAVRRGNPVIFDDSEALNACPKLKNRPNGPLSAVCVPVTFMGRALGVLHSIGAPGERPDGDRLAGLSVLAAQAGARIGTLRSFERAQLQASTDGLTGLLNRRAFEVEAREVLRRDGPVAVVMADLDHFKPLNDTHGHEAGDRALRLFGQVIRGTLREGDLGARIGGEEFGLILRDVAADRVIAVLDRVRETLRDSAAGGTPSFTASFGVCHTEHGGNLDDLLRTADAALYRAKREGRDRVVLADDRDRREESPAVGELGEPAIQLSARHDHLLA